MQSRAAAVPFILVTILIDMLGFGLVIPVLPRLVTEMYDSQTLTTQPRSPRNEVTSSDSAVGEGLVADGAMSQALSGVLRTDPDAASRGAWIYGWFVASYSLMQFLFAPILGNLSDAYGRRPVLLISLFGSAIDYVLLAFAPNLIWLFIGRIISGITGASITAANAYIADVSTPENRARNFGLVGACFGLGFIIGPAVGGVLAKYGLQFPFIAAAILTACNWLYGCFVLPESHPVTNRRALRWSRVNPFGSLRVLNAYPMLFGIMMVIALDRLAHTSLPSTWVLFTSYRFNWDAEKQGWSLALVGLMFAFVQAGLTRYVVKRFGEETAIVFGLTIAFFAYMSYGLATASWMLFVTIMFSSLGGVAGPSLQALISRSVPANEQGAVQGALTSINGLANIIGPLLYTMLFGYFTSRDAPVQIPGIAFFTSAGLVSLAVFLAIGNLRKSVRQAAVPEETESSQGNNPSGSSLSDA